MAEPVRNTRNSRPDTPKQRRPDKEPGITILRWVEGPDGTMEHVELPMTPELFLNPQVGDKMTQGRRHFDTVHEIADLLKKFFAAAGDVIVFGDAKHRFEPGLAEPGPDISVVRGIQRQGDDRESFNASKEGVLPCFILEVVSPLDSRIRKTDLVAKVNLYERVGISEYLIVDSTLRDRRFRLIGHRLDGFGRYRPIEPDTEGRLFSESLGLWFQVSQDGERVLIFDPNGRRLLTSIEEQNRADREVEARMAAEAEVARLKAEIERLRGGG
jgi:Uma2 family endonuclease